MGERASGRHGYTLTEVMISVAIIGILSTVAPPIFIQMQRFYEQNNARNDVQRDARQSLDIINRFLRQAESATITIDQVSGQPPYSRISFTDIQGRSISIWQSGTYLYMKLGNNQSVLAKNLRYIAFVFPRTDDTSIINVSTTMQELSYEGTSKALELSIQKVRIMN